MTAPTVMFCIGATKAGTSWLYRYLHDHPQVWLRSIKEIHFFDTWDLNDHATTRDIFVRHRHGLNARLPAASSDWQRKNIERQIRDADQVLSLIDGDAADAGAYVSYLQEGAGEAQVVGDLTPSYALLSEDRFREMAKMGERVVFIYLMRDPVARLWSHVRMQAVRNPGKKYPLEVKAQNIMGRVVHDKAEKHILERGDYRSVIKRLKASVAPEDCFFEFSENLGSEASVTRLCEFLGIDVAPVKRATAHEGQKIPMREGHEEAAVDLLSRQYKFAKRTFGDLPAKWEARLEALA